MPHRISRETRSDKPTPSWFARWVGETTSASGETMTALDALWAKYDRAWRRLLSRRVIQELMLRASFDLDLLAPERISNTIQAGTIPDCEKCEDICCAGVENVVSLRLRDVALLMDIGRTDLIRREKPRFAESMLERRPALRELVASELFRLLPVLRQEGELRICAALSPELRCTLHPNWPLSCERFPYTLSAVRRQVVWGTRCPSKQQGPTARSEALFKASVATFNERVRDAVLLAHARPALDRLGIGAYLMRPGEDPFEPPEPAHRLPIIA